MAELWYNTNYHTALKTSPFQALYEYPPPQLSLGSTPKSAVQEVDELMKERHKWIIELKEQLRKAQERMKRFADSKRSERQFSVGDWVYLKLQPYRQLTVSKRDNKKLAPKYYGPFEIIAKLGSVAYELKLPIGSQIHPVFHVSQLKGRVGNGQTVTPGVPLQLPLQSVKEIPEGIIGRRMIKRNNAAVPQILIKWKNQDEENCSWKDYEVIKEKFPDFILEDKDYFERRRMSDNLQTRLVTVEKVDLVNEEEVEGIEQGQNGQTFEINRVSLKAGAEHPGRGNKSHTRRNYGSLTVGPKELPLSDSTE